jgi:hypothetical protein
MIYVFSLDGRQRPLRSSNRLSLDFDTGQNPVNAGIWKFMPEFGNVWQSSSDSGGTMPDSSQNDRITPKSNTNSQILVTFAWICMR